VTYVYDTAQNGIGRLTSVTKNLSPQVITAYEYDIWGRTAQEQRNLNNYIYNTQFTYNLSSQPLTITYPDDFMVRYGYNIIGQTNQVYTKEPQAQEAQLIDDVGYSLLGQIEEIDYTNGTISQMTYPITDAYRLTDKITTHGTSTLQDLSYNYDSVGNITRIKDSSPNQLAKTATYSYDDLYRLTSAQIVNDYTHSTSTRTFAYNVIGNPAPLLFSCFWNL